MRAANTLFLDLMGYPLAEVKGQHHTCSSPPPSVTAMRTARSGRLSASWGAADLRVQARRQGGRAVWIQATYNPVLDRAGRVTRVVKFATDITAQVLRNIDHDGQLDALHRSQAVIEFALDGTILTANQNFLDAVGYRLDEVQGRHHSLFVDAGEQAAQPIGSFGRCSAGVSSPQASSVASPRVGAKFGSRRPYNPIRNRDGVPVKVVKFATDITAHTAPDHRCGGQLAAVNRSQAVIQFAPDGTVLDANPNFLQAVGTDRGHPRTAPRHVRRARLREDAGVCRLLGSATQRRVLFRHVPALRQGRSLGLDPGELQPDLRPYGRLTKIVKYATDVTRQHGGAVRRDRGSREDPGSRPVGDGRRRDDERGGPRISRSMAQSKTVVDDIHGRAGEANAATDRLQAAAIAMGGVGAVIAGIAQQINLLALNATIEAARAGLLPQGLRGRRDRGEGVGRSSR